MLKRLLYIILLLTTGLILSYLLQPAKEGKGYESQTTYELVPNWPSLPTDFVLGNPTGIGIDTNQNIVVFHRGSREWPILGPMPDSLIQEKTILLIDRESGKLINSWGNNQFIMPHGLKVDNQNNIWVTDCGLHQVFKFNHDGKLLLKIGVEKESGNDSTHFNKPTDIAITNDGSFYVSDGYGNNRIVKFSPTGRYLFEWGTKGDQPNQFNIPHGITLDQQENLYVADRENNRIQVFSPNGKFIREINDSSFGAITAVCYDTVHSNLLSSDDFSFLQLKHRGSDLMVFDSLFRVKNRFGRSGNYLGKTTWYHDLVVDRDGSIYVGDILGNSVQKFKIHTKK